MRCALIDEYEINALEILGADTDIRELASLEKLRVMAHYAPRRRRLTEAELSRPVQLDSGRETTRGALLCALETRAHIELDVVAFEGKRSKVSICTLCGKDVAVPTMGPIVTACRSELGGCERQTECAVGCGRKPGKQAFYPSIVASRKGAPWRCRPCETEASKTPEQRAEHARKMRAARGAKHGEYDVEPVEREGAIRCASAEEVGNE